MAVLSNRVVCLQHSPNKHVTACHYLEKIHTAIGKIKKIASLDVKLSGSKNEPALLPGASVLLLTSTGNFADPAGGDWINFAKKGAATITTQSEFFE